MIGHARKKIVDAAAPSGEFRDLHWLGPVAVGDVVQVVNPMSKKIVEAVASAPGHALIGPAAEELRQSAAGSTPVNRYASTR